MAIEGLMQTMDKLNQIHLVMLELAELKTSVLVQNQVDKLNQIVNKETSLIKQISELDRQRIEDISQFLVHKGYRPNPNITVEDLVKLLFKAEEKQALKQSQRNLIETLEKIRALNVLNQQLIKQSLAFVDHSIDVLSNVADADIVYHHPNDRNYSNSKSGMFDTKA
jgi:flagellar biosynthesis/type III secretory pathway chaperone